jgi:leukotriene-A4 hydrolase
MPAGHYLTSLLPLVLVVAACAPPEPEVVNDPHSFANPGEIQVTHVHMDLDVDFDRQVLDGHAVLEIKRRARGAERLILDTRDLVIGGVEVERRGEWEATDFRMGASDPELGAALVIELPRRADRVRVSYVTDPGASGLQWLTPAQTAGGEHPFLFSQAQAIHARSFVPLQDTPQARITYSAELRVPEGLLAVMSAENEPQAERGGHFEFHMPEAVPPYLIALAVGDMHFEPVSELVGVYAEREYLEAAVEEFAVTQDMLEATERRYGPYRWGRYDLLVLPPSFPFGGMENPRVSFVTPTILAGDESLVSLVAHELVHSWSGNLVNNAAWRDLWLNEGFTVYLEFRIMEDVYGKERADMEAVIRHLGLKSALANLPAERQILAVDLSGAHADAVFTAIPYAKGRLFLYELERRFSREVFDDFLRGYFDHFAFQAIETEQFVDYLENHLLTENPDVITMERVREWIYEPGLPEDAPVPRSRAFEEVADLRENWLNDDIGVRELRDADWHPLQWVYFLQTLPRELSRARMDALDAAFDLTHSGNYEIAAAWLELAVLNGYSPAMERLETFLVEVGRMKFLRPLYQALVRTEQGRELAEAIYQQARPGYHPLARSTVESILTED